jgi:autotransporter-associated beta strand protein
VSKNTGVSQVVTFSSVTLTGGSATFQPKREGFGFNGGSDLALGAISELVPGSGIIMDGSEDLFLLGGNTYTGATTILRGSTWLAGANALPATTALEVSGGKLFFRDPLGSSFSETVASLSGTSATAEIDNPATDAVRDFTVNQSGDTVFAGRIKGNLNLIKLGAGTLHLSGQNFHSGITTIGAGAISVSDGATQGTINGSVVVEAAARLLGYGAVGELTVESGGRVEPGEGFGVLTTGITTLQFGATFSVELSGTNAGSNYDQLNVLGNVTLNGPVTLELQLGFAPQAFDEFTLILNNGNQPIGGAGRFVYAGNVLENHEIFTASTGPFQQSFEIRYDGGNSGKDLVLVAIPEPSAAVLFLGGLAVLARRRRN